MLVLLLFLGFATYLIVCFYLKVKELPPGPFPLPLIGNLPQLAYGMMCHGDIAKVMQKWTEKYGDVFTWWLGPSAIINLCEYDVAYEAMVKKGGNFASRPKRFFMEMDRGGKGIISSNGQHWTEQCRFALHTLRNFGLGKNVMQDRIMLEYDYRTSKLNKQIEEAGGTLNFDPYSLAELTVGNIINRLLFSERFTDEKEKQFFKLKRDMDEMIENMTVLDFMIDEWSSKIPPFKQRWQSIITPVKNIVSFIGDQIQQRKQDIENGKHTLTDQGEDFVDAFLFEMLKKDRGESFEEDSLKMTLLDLWAAGQETTATSLYWMLNYLLLHPEVDQKLKAELDEVTGRNRPLGLSDKANTPYLNATILECFRLGSIVPLNLWRETEEDIIVGRHRIPKGSLISAQLSVLMADKKHFLDPEEFKPERFLESGAEQYLTPFGLGKRACPGEALARAELYLIFGNLVLNYDFARDAHHPPSMKARAQKGTARRAVEYHVNLSLRK